METRRGVLALAFLAVFAAHAPGAFNEAEWRKTYDDPKVRAATEQYLSPGPTVERSVREEALRAGTLPKDPARAEQYIKDNAAFYSDFYSTIYKRSKIDTALARRVLANPDFDEFDKGNAALLLYIDSGDVGYLKRYLLSDPSRPYLFLRVHDPAVVKLALEIVGEAYKERFENLNGAPGKYVTIVSRSLPAFAGMMYVQDGGDWAVGMLWFRDTWFFSGAAGTTGAFAPLGAARALYRQGQRRALQELLYAQYQNGDSNELANIKRNATPELAEIVDHVGERYRANVRKMLDQVSATKPTATLSPPTQPGGKAR